MMKALTISEHVQKMNGINAVTVEISCCIIFSSWEMVKKMTTYFDTASLNAVP